MKLESLRNAEINIKHLAHRVFVVFQPIKLQRFTVKATVFFMFFSLQ